ncbi:S66 peptidase family protein [Fulvivirga sediminis]|uniref:LD-carboxypeptidase n=1 Tax=Fulvivirga sediminis TaxID=2803949 RepID=A0A937JWW3_9BACT|nr:LD-carboxypeptidase [Fulvivirga sediminis]MBL3654908.1 LD-carboxypeptidase [Fulvivirga sediminis]
MNLRPPLLRAGDKIGIVSPSRMILPEQIDHAINVFQEWDLEVILSPQLYASEGYFAGADEIRRAEMQSCLDNPELKAVLCARGGYGMTRFIDDIDFSGIKNYPKWLVGFSDITAMHVALNNNNIESIHGIMPAQFGYEGVSESVSSLKKILFEGSVKYSIKGSYRNRHGIAKAEVIGGNLSLLADSLGTATEVQAKGKIMLIEEIDEYLYKIDRMLTQLRRAGKFDDLAGVIVGDFSGVKDTTIPFGKNIKDLIGSHFESYSYPLCFDFPAGHEPYNLAIPFGRSLSFMVNENEVSLLE